MTDDRRLEEIRKRLGDSLGRYDLNDAVDDVTYLLKRLESQKEMFETALREKGWVTEITRLHADLSAARTRLERAEDLFHRTMNWIPPQFITFRADIEEWLRGEPVVGEKA